jgi:hypothetical protein
MASMLHLLVREVAELCNYPVDVSYIGLYVYKFGTVAHFYLEGLNHGIHSLCSKLMTLYFTYQLKYKLEMVLLVFPTLVTLSDRGHLVLRQISLR